MLYFVKILADQLIVIKYKDSESMIEVKYLSNNLVGFQARFQTAGNLIFNPPAGSSLKITGIFYFN
jgi:hypothetical protein